MVKNFIIIMGILSVCVMPCCAKSVNGIETTAKQHTITPNSPYYNGMYNGKFYSNKFYRVRKIKTKDENGKTVVYTETIPCDRFGRRCGEYGSYIYNPIINQTRFYPRQTIGVGSSITIKF